MNVSLRSYYLKALGIENWKLRVLVNPQPFYYRYELQNLQSETIGWLLADSNAQQSEDLKKEQQLLKAIVQALGRQIRIHPISETVASHPVSPLISSLPLILMGEQVAKKYGNLQSDQQVKCVTHAPMTLLQKPILKAETWDSLKKIIPILQKKLD